MIHIDKQGTDPWFNIAADEFVLKQLQEDVFMVWNNTPCVVVGKHQHALAEINQSFLQTNHIPVIRRISGGGTVYHDEYCLNYSFITNAKSDSDKINFDYFTRPIRDFLQSIGIDARLTDKSTLMVDDRKISGNAAHLFKSRSIHHGTLLYDTDLHKLYESIESAGRTYHSKAVPSNRSRVVNIKSLLADKLSMEHFKAQFVRFLMDWFGCRESRSFHQYEIQAIQKLAEEKYKSWSWTYGYSPDYHFESLINLKGVQIPVIIQVKKGNITSVAAANGTQPELLLHLNEILRDVKFEINAIRERLRPHSLHFSQSEKQFNQLIQQII